jgi:hypothetical protein
MRKCFYDYDLTCLSTVGFRWFDNDTLPNFLVRSKRSSNYLVLSDEVWIECLDDECSSKVIKLMKTLNLSRANWCVRDNKLKMIT